MGKHRIQADICFANEQDALDLLNYLESIKSKAVMITAQGKSVSRSVRYHACYHDDVPPKKCGNYIVMDFEGKQIIY